MRNPLVLSLFLISAVLPAQSASVTNYGRGCELTSNPPPLIRANNLPKIGTTFQVRFIGPNSVTPVSQDQPVLVTGLSSAAVTIPPISSLQPANCQLLVNPLLFLFMPRSGSAYLGQVDMPIPNNRSLLGFTVYQQFASIYRRCGSVGCVDQMIRVSDGLKVVVGT